MADDTRSALENYLAKLIHERGAAYEARDRAEKNFECEIEASERRRAREEEEREQYLHSQLARMREHGEKIESLDKLIAEIRDELHRTRRIEANFAGLRRGPDEDR